MTNATVVQKNVVSPSPVSTRYGNDRSRLGGVQLNPATCDGDTVRHGHILVRGQLVTALLQRRKAHTFHQFSPHSALPPSSVSAPKPSHWLPIDLVSLLQAVTAFPRSVPQGCHSFLEGSAAIRTKSRCRSLSGLTLRRLPSYHALPIGVRSG